MNALVPSRANLLRALASTPPEMHDEVARAHGFERSSAHQHPKQGELFGKKVRVTFRGDTGTTVLGTVVRDDEEGQGVTIIFLDDGHLILGTECLYSPLD